jgi:hypothetical protein
MNAFRLRHISQAMDDFFCLSRAAAAAAEAATGGSSKNEVFPMVR